MTPSERTNRSMRLHESISPPLLEALQEAYGESLPQAYLAGAYSWIFGPRLDSAQDLSLATDSQVGQMATVAKTIGENLPHEQTTFEAFREALDFAIESKSDSPTPYC